MDSALYFLRYLNMRSAWAKKRGCLSPEIRIESKCDPEESPAFSSDVVSVSVPMPGMFLLAHPLLGDYFKRSVVFLVGHEWVLRVPGLKLIVPLCPQVVWYYAVRTARLGLWLTLGSQLGQ
jgi:hypothetical protein